MKTNFFRNVNYIGWIVIILAFVFLYFSYFFIYIPRQETQLQQRAFRILKEYGDNMFGKSKYYKNHFENYRLYYKIRYYTELKKIQKDTTLNEEDSKAHDEVMSVLGGLPSFVVIDDSLKPELKKTFVLPEGDSRLFINYNSQLSESVKQESVRSLSKFFNSNDADFNSESFLSQEVCYNVPIKEFMDGLRFDFLFENIIIFDDSLVYHNTRLEDVTDITNPKALSDSVKNAQGGIWITLNIRGKDNHVMILPIDFLGKRFYLAGLINDSAYESKTQTINSQILILIAALLLLVLIGMPILKMIFISRNERLNSVDASGSAISTIFGTGLLILITIGVIKHEFVDHPLLSERLTQISNQLMKNITADIDSVKNLYTAISDTNSVKSNPLSAFTNEKFLVKNKKFHLYNDSLLDGMFPINEIILIDSAGIVAKAVTSTPFSEMVPVNLSQRQYFINAANSLRSWPSKDGLKFYIESIKSYNTGDGETAISFQNNSTSNPVVAITAAIPSFYKQVLPKDVEYVIVNNLGEVLYHSIKTKNLHENFIDECNFNGQLKKAMDFRTEEIMHIDYNEREWMARIVPFENTPLFHITLIDLNQTEDKNARIFLFTFYFLFISLIVVAIGMLIMRWIIPTHSLPRNKRWFLSWLLYRPDKYILYKRLSVVLFLIIGIQYIGIWITVKPIVILFYQILFIVYSCFISMVFLKRSQLNFRRMFKREYLPENVIFLIFVLCVLLFLWKFFPGLPILVPLVFVVILTAIVPQILKYDKKKIQLKIDSNELKKNTIKRMYLTFLFLWLVSIAIIPVIQYYFSIKNQEEQLWNLEQQFTIAEKNLELQKDCEKYGETSWFKQIQGNDIDSFKIGFLSDEKIIQRNDTFQRSENIANVGNRADNFYASLPDPVTNGNEINAFFNKTNFTNEWQITDSLIYSKGGKYGTVFVKSGSITSGFKDFNLWIWRFWIVILILSVFIILLLKYVASVVLNLKIEDFMISKSNWIDALFKSTGSNSILLQSYNGEYFLKETVNYINTHKNTEIRSVILIRANQLSDPDFKYKSFVSQPNSVLWITGFDPIIQDVNNHELLLTRLLDINQERTEKVVIDLPFDLDFIDEKFESYIHENEVEKEKRIHLNLLKKRWRLVFKNFMAFNGFRFPNVEDKLSKSFLTEELNVQHSVIWNNLTSFEKIVLFDLADDGLVNIKNMQTINHLVSKNLIELKPYPKLITKDFKNYIVQNQAHSDIKALEKKLGIKGSWRNTRYLILMILIPLAAFILISQGVSFEKIFGIFAGILTIVTGTIRLFDSNTFKQSS